MKSGIEYMTFWQNWYTDTSEKGIGCFSNRLANRLRFPNLCLCLCCTRILKDRPPFWRLFLPIHDFDHKFIGSYSGQCRNREITWGKLDINTPKFIIESGCNHVKRLNFCLPIRHVNYGQI